MMIDFILESFNDSHNNHSNSVFCTGEKCSICEWYYKEIKKLEKCNNCNQNKAIEHHNCPYLEDIKEDKKSKCNCCDECEKECIRNI